MSARTEWSIRERGNMYHYITFMVLYHRHYFPVGMYSGPRVAGRVGFSTTHGLAAFLRVWAQHLARHRGFTGKGWGVKLGQGGSLAGSTLHPIWLRWLRSAGHCEVWGAYIRHQLIHTVHIRVG